MVSKVRGVTCANDPSLVKHRFFFTYELILIIVPKLDGRICFISQQSRDIYYNGKDHESRRGSMRGAQDSLFSHVLYIWISHYADFWVHLEAENAWPDVHGVRGSCINLTLTKLLYYQALMLDISPLKSIIFAIQDVEQSHHCLSSISMCVMKL